MEYGKESGTDTLICDSRLLVKAMQPDELGLTRLKRGERVGSGLRFAL
jgi:hypothetical protein